MTPVTNSIYGPRHYDDLFEARHGRRAVPKPHSRPSSLIGLWNLRVGDSSFTENITQNDHTTKTVLQILLLIQGQLQHLVITSRLDFVG